MSNSSFKPEYPPDGYEYIHSGESKVGDKYWSNITNTWNSVVALGDNVTHYLALCRPKVITPPAGYRIITDGLIVPGDMYYSHTTSRWCAMPRSGASVSEYAKVCRLSRLDSDIKIPAGWYQVTSGNNIVKGDNYWCTPLGKWSDCQLTVGWVVANNDFIIRKDGATMKDEPVVRSDSIAMAMSQFRTAGEPKGCTIGDTPYGYIRLTVGDSKTKVGDICYLPEGFWVPVKLADQAVSNYYAVARPVGEDAKGLKAFDGDNQALRDEGKLQERDRLLHGLLQVGSHLMCHYLNNKDEPRWKERVEVVIEMLASTGCVPKGNTAESWLMVETMNRCKLEKVGSLFRMALINPLK